MKFSSIFGILPEFIVTEKTFLAYFVHLSNTSMELYLAMCIKEILLDRPFQHRRTIEEIKSQSHYSFFYFADLSISSTESSVSSILKIYA